MKDIILKSWRTTLIGLVILIGLVYTAVTKGFGIAESLSGLIAVGFLLSKDAKASHSNVTDPDRPETPSTKE